MLGRCCMKAHVLFTRKTASYCSLWLWFTDIIGTIDFVYKEISRNQSTSPEFLCVSVKQTYSTNPFSVLFQLCQVIFWSPFYLLCFVVVRESSLYWFPLSPWFLDHVGVICLFCDQIPVVMWDPDDARASSAGCSHARPRCCVACP